MLILNNSLNIDHFSMYLCTVTQKKFFFFLFNVKSKLICNFEIVVIRLLTLRKIRKKERHFFLEGNRKTSSNENMYINCSIFKYTRKKKQYWMYLRNKKKMDYVNSA